MFTNLEWSDLGRCLRAMWDSIAMAWLGTLLAAVVAVPLGFLAAENLVPRWFSFLLRQLFNVLRAVPELILVLALIPVLGLTKTAGIMAIAIGSIGTLGKLCSEIVEGVDRGPIEAADSVGASQLQRLRWAVVPQTMPEIASFVLYRFEINIRVSAVLGVLGVGGIGQILSESLRFKEWGLAGMALIVVVVATILIDTRVGRGAPPHPRRPPWSDSSSPTNRRPPPRSSSDHPSVSGHRSVTRRTVSPRTLRCQPPGEGQHVGVVGHRERLIVVEEAVGQGDADRAVGVAAADRSPPSTTVERRGRARRAGRRARRATTPWRSGGAPRARPG